MTLSLGKVSTCKRFSLLVHFNVGYICHPNLIGGKRIKGLDE